MTSKSRIILAISSIAFGILSSISAFSQVPRVGLGGPQPPAIKVAIVNMQDAILNTDEGIKEFSALEQRFTPRKEELRKANEEVEGLKKQVSTPDPKLSDDQRRNLVNTLETKKKIFERNFEDFQIEVEKSGQETINRIGEKMMKIVEKYAAAQGYTLVLDVSNPQSGVIWTSSSANITKELIAAYKSQFPVNSTAVKPGTARP
jgi:outer membrane protein